MKDMAKSISIAGLSQAVAGTARAAIDWVASIEAVGIQLDGTMAGLRARELDRSGRRDLAAILRRAELALSGIDLWIPARHFVDAGYQDRAIGAVVEALELAADLARLGAGEAVVSVLLPPSAPQQMVGAMVEAGDRVGAVLADHAHPIREGVGVGVDPAMVLAAGDDPSQVVARAGARLASARWSDASAAGRVVVGSADGQLDVMGYEVALSIAGYGRPVVVDLRGLGDRQERAAREGVRA